MKYLQLKPAKAKRKNPEPLWDDRSFIAEEKFDGWRMLSHFGGDCDRNYITGRRPSTVTGLYSEKGLLVPELWPRGMSRRLGYTVVDGEIIPPDGANFRDMAGLLNAESGKVRKKIEEIGIPRFVAYDILFHDGVDLRKLTAFKRRAILETLIPTLQNEYISIAAQAFDDKYLFYEGIVKLGGEGVILKDISAEYGEGWVKVKRTHTIDVVITGFTEARMGRTGKYLGQIGAALVSVYGPSGIMIQVGKVSGMTDATRLDMTENSAQWVGKVLEIEASGWAKEMLWHPRFKRERPDADPHSCTYSKMMEDLGLSPGEANEKQLTLF